MNCPICAGANADVYLVTCARPHRICRSCEAQRIQVVLSDKIASWDCTSSIRIHCHECRILHTVSDVKKNEQRAFSAPESSVFATISYGVRSTYHILMGMISEVALGILYLGDQGFIGADTYEEYRQQNYVQRLTQVFMEYHNVPYNGGEKEATVWMSRGYELSSIKKTVKYHPTLTWETRIWRILSTSLTSARS